MTTGLGATWTWAWLTWVWVWACGVGVTEGEPVAGQLYSSLARMDDLFVFDRLVGDLLPLLPEHIPEASRYQESFSSVKEDLEQVGGGQVTSVEITGNPLHVYSVIKRLVLYWPALNRTLQHYHTQEGGCVNRNTECMRWAMRGHCLHTRPYMILNCQLACGACPPPGLRERVAEVMEAQNRTVLPSHDDLRGAAYALGRLHRVYRIPISSFMQGRLDHTYCSIRLTPEDCVRVANATDYYGMVADAWTWYDYCRASTDDPHLQDRIENIMDELQLLHDREWRENDTRYFPRPLAESWNQVAWDTPYYKLCRGVVTRVQDHLECKVSARGSHYLLLQPVRYEQVSRDPDIYLFYDVLTDEEMRAVKEVAKEKLARSVVVSRATPRTEGRVSHTAWLCNTSHPYLANIARRVSLITGLLVHEGIAERKAGEPLQVLNYGIGGHYANHLDHFYKKFPEHRWNESEVNPKEFLPGDRLATWIFYLSEVKSGGRTGFPWAGVSVTPVKGAAAFWYNLKRNGDGDYRTEHGGCPVLLGHKWVANKWIREHMNFNHRRCSTNPEE